MSWTWGNAWDHYEATLSGDTIMWSWLGPKDMGGASEQSVDDYLVAGPLDRDAPAHVLAALDEAIRKRDEAGWPDRRARAEAERDARQQTREAGRRAEAEADRAAAARHAEIRSWQDPWRQYEKPPVARAPTPQSTLPLWPGLAVFVAGVGAPLLLAIHAPLAAGYASLFLPVLLGFGAAFYFGRASLVVAGFFAMAGGIGAQLAFARHAELAGGAAVELASITEAARHPEATRFRVGDARVAGEFAGAVTRVSTRSTGAGPREQRQVFQVAPLVPRGWTRAEPAPAWIACVTTPGFDCLPRDGQPFAGLVRARPESSRDHRDAIAEAARRHGIASAAGAPVLEPSRDPEGAPGNYLLASLSWPLAAFTAWLLACALWRRFGRA